MREEMGAIGRDSVINGFSCIQNKTKQNKPRVWILTVDFQ